jgi:hypothetical protein
LIVIAVLAVFSGVCTFVVATYWEPIRNWWRGWTERREEREEARVAALMAQPLLVRTYRSERAYQEDASELAHYGFLVASVTSRQQSRTCLILILILTFWLILPLIFLVLLLVLSPPGTYLVVTYERRR